jgi:hypothetical protein
MGVPYAGFELQVGESQGGRLGRYDWPPDVLGGRLIQDTIIDSGPAEAGGDGKPARNRGRFEPAHFLHPADLELQVRPVCRLRIKAPVSAPDQEAAEIRARVIARSAGKPGQVSGGRQVELIVARQV